MIAYVHGSYMTLGEQVGSFGYSVRKKAIEEPVEEIKNAQ